MLNKNKIPSLYIFLSFVFYIVFAVFLFNHIFINIFQSIDLSVLNGFYSHRSLALTLFSKGMTFIFNPTSVIVEILICTYLFWRIKKNNAIVVLFFTVVLNEGLVYVSKIFFARERPLLSMRLVDETDYSFPSGHSSIAIVLCGILSFLLIRTIKMKIGGAWAMFIASFVIAIAIGVGRVYLGVHYPSDVLFGYILGLGSLFAGMSLFDYLEGRNK